jgi:hypothetical protein
MPGSGKMTKQKTPAKKKATKAKRTPDLTIDQVCQILQLNNRFTPTQIQNISEKSRSLSKLGLSPATIAARLNSRDQPTPTSSPHKQSLAHSSTQIEERPFASVTQNASMSSPPPHDDNAVAGPSETINQPPPPTNTILSDSEIEEMESQHSIESRSKRARSSSVSSSDSEIPSPHKKQMKSPPHTITTHTINSNKSCTQPKPSSTPPPSLMSLNPIPTLNTKTQNSNKPSPLIVLLKEGISPAKVKTLIKHQISGSRVTPAGNTLVYPKTEGDSNALQAIKNDEFSIRPTKGSQRRQATPNQTAPPPPKTENLFAVISNVSKDITDQEITDETGFPSKRLISAATDTPTKSVKITLPDAATKQKVLKDGISVIFTKHKVVDYHNKRPLQCLSCYKFGHQIKDCTHNPRCKLCDSSEHKHNECPKTLSKCPNCQGPHAATFSGCPAYQEARQAQQGKQITWAQKVAAPSPAIHTTRLAYAISQSLYHSLKGHLPGLDCQDVIQKVCQTVTQAFKTHTLPHAVKALKPQQ